MLLLQRLGVFLTKFNKKKVEMRHSLLAKDGLQGSSNAHKFIAQKLVERLLVPTLKQLACSPPNSRKSLRTMTFHQILLLTWMSRVVLEKVTIKNLYIEGRKIGAWLQGIQGPTYSAPWRQRIRNSRNSQSNERHSKISFASHLDFKQKGLDHATNFLRKVF